MRGTVIIFAKAPRSGAVKTRLAKGVGGARATALYRAMAGRTIAEARKGNWETKLAIDPDYTVNGSLVFDASVTRVPQGRGDLGMRMDRAIKRTRSGPVVIIGTDAPGFRAAHLRTAFQKMRSADAVFGPANDGGYWLVGFSRRRVLRQYFNNVRWSSADALQDTLAGLPKSFKVAMLETLSDVDSAADLKHLRARSTAQ